MNKKLLVLITLLLNTLTYANYNYTVPKLKNPPLIDGSVKDSEATEMLLLDKFYEIYPRLNGEATEKTEVYFGYDETNIYVLAKCFMKNKEELRKFHCSRDNLGSSDRVQVYLDTFNSKRKAYFLTTNMYGEQEDGVQANHHDSSVDLFYYSKGSLTDYGYDIEMAIPLKSINYTDGKNVKWGVFLKRVIPGNDQTLSLFPENREASNYFDNYGTLNFTELPNKQSLKLTPSFITKYNHFEDRKQSFLNDESDDFQGEINIAYEPNSSLLITGTINPDFSTIELDGLRNDYNVEFSAALQEKRSFFLEETNAYNPNISIYRTRSIFDPNWGIKFTGKSGNFAYYGVLAEDNQVNLSTFYPAVSEDLDQKKDSRSVFVTVSYDLDSRGSYFRIANAYNRFGRYGNNALSGDFNYYLSRNFRLNNQTVSTFKDELSGSTTTGFGNQTVMSLNFGNFSNTLNHKMLDKNFQSDLGYIPFKDIQYTTNYFQYLNNEGIVRGVKFFRASNSSWLKYDFEFDKRKEIFTCFEQFFAFKNNIGWRVGEQEGLTYYGGEENNRRFYYQELYIDTFKEFGGSIYTETGKDIWWNSSNKGITETYWSVRAESYFRFGDFFDSHFKYEVRSLKSYFKSRTYELWSKFQFNKKFWLRAIIQLADTEIWAYNYQSLSFNIYPLFVYKPDANIAVYLGMTNEQIEKEIFSYNQETEEYTKTRISDSNDDRIFLKVSYGIDIY